MAQKLEQSTLRAVARILKKQGIGKPLDTRHNLTASTLRGGKSLKEWSKIFSPVIEGEASIIPVSSTTEKRNNKYQRVIGVNPRTGKKTEYFVVPHSRDEKVKLVDGYIDITHPAGIERIQIPVEYHNLEQWARDFEKWASDKKELRKMLKNSNYHFAFRYFGNSSQVYRHMDLLADEFVHYKSVQESMDGSPYQQRLVYRNFELVVVSSQKTWEKQRNANKRKKPRRKKK